MPTRQPKKGRLWLNDGSCLRLRPERANHVWAYDFVEARTHDGRKFRMLCVVDEFTGECPAIRVKRKLNSSDVLEVLAELMLARGTPSHIRSDNGPEFAAVAVKTWLGNLGVNTSRFARIASRCHRARNPVGKRLCRKLQLQAPRRAASRRDLLLAEGGSDTDRGWRRHYNTVRPHSALGWLLPAPEVSVIPAAVWPRPGTSIEIATHATVH